MRFRVVEWLDLNGPKCVHGIEAKAEWWKKWRPIMEDGRPLAFEMYADALAKQAELELRGQQGTLYSREFSGSSDA